MDEDRLLALLERFQAERVEYILVGGHAVRLNGFVRSTEDIDILLPSSVENGRRVIRALGFLQSSAELQPEWFVVSPDGPENIRVADDLLIDLLFAANGETYESLRPHVRTIDILGVQVRTLDIEGLLKTKTNYRGKDLADRQVLQSLQAVVPTMQQLKNTRLIRIHGSDAIDKLGFDLASRTVVVVFKGGDTVYGYPNLSDDEVEGLLAVLENGQSLGHFVATVIKPNHDHERVQL
jgi:hypothetical protein